MSVAFCPSRLSLARAPCARPSVAARAKVGNWLPGSSSPSVLDGSLPGDYGFDPLGLATPESIGRLQEGEVINGRWAMLACAGCLLPELLGFGNWFDAPLWAVNGGQATYFGVPVPFNVATLVLVELVLMAGAELLRGSSQEDPTKRVYPGGAFDPLGYANDASKLEELKLKEIKNGRLAMVSFMGYVAQHQATGKGPLAALADHLGSPATANFATNGTSLPKFAFPFLY